MDKVRWGIIGCVPRYTPRLWRGALGMVGRGSQRGNK